MAAEPASALAFSHEHMATIITEPKAMAPNIRARLAASSTWGRKRIMKVQKA
jgi:hypothetical protein